MLRNAVLWLIAAIILAVPNVGATGHICSRGAYSHTRAPAPQAAAPCTDCFDLAEGSSKSCTETCMSQCRNSEKSCSGAGCNAQFQICARRCVVSCGSR